MPISAILKLRPRVPLGVTIRSDINLRNFKLKLTSIAQLHQSVYGQVSFAANLLMIEHYSMSTETRRQKMDDAIIAALSNSSSSSNTSGESDRSTHFKNFLSSNIVIRDLLLGALRHDMDYQMAAMELYIRKIYNKTHSIKNFTLGLLMNNQSMGLDVNYMPYMKFEFITKSFEASNGETSPGPPSPARGSSQNLLSFSSSMGTSKKNISFTDLTTLTRSTSGNHVLNQQSDSVDNMNHPIVPGKRLGVFAKLEDLSELPTMFPQICDMIPNVACKPDHKGM